MFLAMPYWEEEPRRGRSEADNLYFLMPDQASLVLGSRSDIEASLFLAPRGPEGRAPMGTWWWRL